MIEIIELSLNFFELKYSWCASLQSCQPQVLIKKIDASWLHWHPPAFSLVNDGLQRSLCQPLMKFTNEAVLREIDLWWAECVKCLSSRLCWVSKAITRAIKSQNAAYMSQNYKAFLLNSFCSPVSFSSLQQTWRLTRIPNKHQYKDASNQSQSNTQAKPSREVLYLCSGAQELTSPFSVLIITPERRAIGS